MRRWRKSHGYPASRDAGILGEYVKKLRQEAEDFTKEPLTVTAASFPNLVALYEEDVVDAFEWAGLKHQEFYLSHPLRAVSGQYAAYGFGLCSDYKEKETCREEEKKLPLGRTVNIQFTKDALIVEVPTLRLAERPIMYWAHTFIDFELGYNSRNSSQFWESVRARIEDHFRKNLHADDWNEFSDIPSKVFVVGDKSVHDENFRSVVNEACFWKRGELEFFDDDVIFKTAKGTAEIMRRSLWFK